MNSKSSKRVLNAEKVIMSSNMSSVNNMNCNNAIDNDVFDIKNNKYIEEPWSIIESYFRGQNLERFVRHQIESYNNFIGYQCTKTIEMFNPVNIASEQDLDPNTKKYSLELFITFENFHIYRPQIHENNGAIKLMFPQEARLRNFTYASAMTIDINIKYIVRNGTDLQNVQTFYKTLPKIHIGKIPIMVKSSVCVLNQYKHFSPAQTGECEYDAGGYFIINGSEKTVLGQERAAENRVYCFNVSKNNTRYSWQAEINSIPDSKCISPKKIVMMINAKDVNVSANVKTGGPANSIVVQIPRVKDPIPLFIVFRALGVISDKDICEKILLNIEHENNKDLLSALQASIIHSNKYLTQELCISYITNHVMYTPLNMDKASGLKKKRDFAVEILENDLFPHCHNATQKIYFLGYMANRLLMSTFEIIKQDDRDSYLNKRIDLTGALLNNLFRNYFNKLVKDMEKQIIREINTGSWKSSDDYENIINLTNIYKIIKSTTIENGIKRALSTGDFGIKHTNSNKVGVAQVLNRLNYVSSLSHLRRISTPTDKSGKLIPPRKLHNTTWGFLCPSETPEGQSVGVVKNLSYMSHITIYSNSLPLYEYILPNIISIDNEELTSEDMYEKVKVFINGSWVGFTDKPKELYESLKDKKYKGIINIYTSIIFDYKMKEIRVCNDSGRITRPLLRVKNRNIMISNNIINKLNKNEINWDNLLTSSELNEAIIEYIDPEEQSLSLIATKPIDLVKQDKMMRYTHCEIHPSTIFGVLASCIPFPEHNQSPRNTYQCAQAKQAMGIYVTNFDNRLDKTAYLLNYPMRPLVDTRIMNLIKLNEIPSGTQVIVAIMTHTGYNQEDSLLINKGSIDRGMALTTVFHTEKDEDKQKINGDEEIRCKPDSTKTKGMKIGANYNKVNSKGVIPENTLLENRDVIISKVTPIKENKNDHTKVIKFEDQSKLYKTVEESYIDKNYIDRNGEGYNFAKVRIRAVRKPVIGDKFSSRHGQKGTVGNIIPECDMPFTSDGIKPDIIINPHAIPSRMTIGQLKETVLGKVLVELGLFGDGTSFGEFDLKDICSELLKLGYEAHGNELLYNGLTGEQHECSVFMGPVFYQRLKHMVNDKAHSRANGPMVNLTRQPAEGRSRDGGHRFGEMERDCFVGHTPITLNCGLSIAIENLENNNQELFGWNKNSKTMINSKQIGFMCKGERECVKLTLEDGRTVICTDNHKLLKSNGEWTTVSNLKINEDRLTSSVTYPLCEVIDEIKECNNWSIRLDDIKLETNNKNAFIRTISFMRILGYFWADGGIYNLKNNCRYGRIILGHMNDVNNIINDLSLFDTIRQKKFKTCNYYSVSLSEKIITNLLKIKGIQVGRKINQPAQLPEFILDPNCPKPIIREFLGGLFGGDGHTCYLGMHRGKRDLLSSISFSKSKTSENIESLTKMMEDIKYLLSKFDINNVTIQGVKETSSSKKKNVNKSYQLTLHLSIDELIPFSEKIGFRYCCHKSQRLEAGVSYKRLRNEVVRQHNWLVNRVDELTNFTAIKAENPNKIVHTKEAIAKAVEDLKKLEPLIHEYAIPSCHDINDHFIKGTKFGSFRGSKFPTAEQYFKEIGAYSWFMEENIKQNIVDDEDLNEDLNNNEIDSDINDYDNKVNYGVSRECEGIPTMDLKVIDIRPAGIHKVYDIEVKNTHSFLANGIVAHNCMISHGAARFTRGRMYDASDKYSVHVCKKCGLIASYNDKMNIHHCHTCDNRVDFAYVEIPYACKLLFQELNTMNIAPRFITDN